MDNICKTWTKDQVKTAFVEGLPNSWDKQKVNEHSKQYGEIEKIQLSRNFTTTRCKEFGTLDPVSSCRLTSGRFPWSSEVWTHNTRAAMVMHVTDEAANSAITDLQRLSKIKELLCNVLQGSNKMRRAKTVVSLGSTHTERRLHQMMFDDWDYERSDIDTGDEVLRFNVTVVNWCDKDYSVVTIRCKDRPKLLFDTVCTLTDMQYVVFHANIEAEGPEAYQEYYIRHIDGFLVNSEVEKQRVIQCLKAVMKILQCAQDGIEVWMSSGGCDYTLVDSM